ncbi:retrotransposon protein [Cucumis melo var. makuwa]|uniref:Retrotransposon protein n=1 Tax=Cucumis melo var. makuwa TaxID=1194695 RepID=A0A5D3E6F3_CUCMM|nr:retrotransposon protein [Cucumis melo var. makuwa]TYK31554.1 retrotransposon protein [Cucumis melo var. makuwa]
MSYVFGKDHATGARADTFVDIGSNDPAGYEVFASDAMSDMDFQLMYSQGLNMSPNKLMGTRTTWISEGSIVEWLVLQHQDTSQTSQEVVRQLKAIPELTLMDRCRLMCILIHNVEDMKAFLDVPNNMKYPFCSIILEENQ